LFNISFTCIIVMKIYIIFHSKASIFGSSIGPNQQDGGEGDIYVCRWESYRYDIKMW
jgi:hypothetical protein